MNNTQSEQSLENKLIEQLESMEYEYKPLKNEKEMISNLKEQLEIHNHTKFSDKEFTRILNYLNKWSIFDRAKKLRDKMALKRDDESIKYIEFLNIDHWCQNEYQVTNQVTMEWKYKNRYDVTILINWFPLVQIELKRRWLELKEAFNQTWRYHKHSFWAWNWLFQYIQIFVISNWVDTKYYANNKNQSFKQTFFWADKKNKNFTNLDEFTSTFFEPCHLSKMIAKYIVLNETEKILMVLRPYQYYAVEAIIDRVKDTDKNGYIWHTTWSWKTLTSFKASQILMKLPKVKKVVFVVDRKDLDYQTSREFNNFSRWSVDWTDNTRKLVSQFQDVNTKLIVTTIQKLNTAIKKERYLKKMENIKDEKVIFIFDECHRSQFWETHKRIKKFFTNHQMFGFTWTPILAEIAQNNQTTANLFGGGAIHKYVITDAIRDENVLRFSVEYVWRYKWKENLKTNLDIEVEDIDKKEVVESPKRLEKIVDYILLDHNNKTHSRYFTAMFCVSSIEVLTKYYDIFKTRKHNLKIATIFSYWPNEDDSEANWFIWDMRFDIKESEVNQHSRDKLESYIWDYNKMFDTNFTTKDTNSFYNYYNDIAKRVKRREIDILLVVNMFLTWFDSKTLNTLYVDKNLKHHWLIQAFSRTNRILNEQKSQGNIVCFRDLKDNVDEAIKTFSNSEAKELILMDSYESYIDKFNKSLDNLYKIAPNFDSVNDLIWEHEQLKFVQSFRELVRLKNILSTFADFDFKDLKIDEQNFENYKSKYLSIFSSVKNRTEKEKVSILDDVDFELELIRRDEINVDYILNLLAQVVDSNSTVNKEKTKKDVLNMVENEISLRSKKELIQKFIEENLPNIKDSNNVSSEFEKYFESERKKELEKFCKEEFLDKEKFQDVIKGYLYTGKLPLRDDIFGSMKKIPRLKERTSIFNRVIWKVKDFIEKFEEL